MTVPSPRRTFLLQSAAVAGAALLPSAARTATSVDPRATAEGQIRMRSTLDGSLAAWSYSGTVYAVQPDRRPVAILAVSGCQTEWARPLEGGAYRTAGMLLSYFRDPVSGEFLDRWSNPFTGRENTVGANRFAGGSAFYPADGTGMRIAGLAASESAPRGFDESGKSAGPVAWEVTRDRVLLRVDHVFDVRVQPQTEAQSLFADRAAFFDPAVTRLPATYAATSILPWLRWMDMAGVPGHLVWHTAGEKLFSIDQLPEDYRRHAGRAVDELALRPKDLDR